MDTFICYFTGTGNSLLAARKLASALEDAALRPIAEDGHTALSASAVGFVFPVYLWGTPRIVREFINKNKDGIKGKYLFAVATYKSDPGNVIGQLKRIMAKLGLTLSAGYVVPMPGNNIIFYDIETSQAMENKFNASGKRLAEIASDILQRREASPDTSLPDRLLKTGLLHPLLTGTFEKSDKNFWTEASCNGCGICGRVCPMSNIAISGGRPVWQHRCQQCLACLHTCPAEAIQYGKTTVGRKRYLNPAGTVQDLIRRDI